MPFCTPIRRCARNRTHWRHGPSYRAPHKSTQNESLSDTDGAGAGITDDRKAEIEELALYLVDCHRNGQDMEAIALWYAAETFADNDERVYCWSLLGAESKLRATIKDNTPVERKAE
jgi:hypothetical protein